MEEQEALVCMANANFRRWVDFREFNRGKCGKDRVDGGVKKGD